MRSGGLEQCTGPTFFFSCGGAGWKGRDGYKQNLDPEVTFSIKTGWPKNPSSIHMCFFPFPSKDNFLIAGL